MKQLSLVLREFWSGLPDAIACFGGAFCAVLREESDHGQ
jgi:hypothetical protein